MDLENFRNTIKATRQAIVFRLNQEKKRTDEDDLPPRTNIELFHIALSTLFDTDELKKWLLFSSSCEHGRWVLDQAFPLSDNPGEFHSHEGVVRLDEHPIQALGWAEVAKLKTQGEQEGLDRIWIEVGFETRADERGIDLEWHFFEKPLGETPSNPNSPVVSNTLSNITSQFP